MCTISFIFLTKLFILFIILSFTKEMKYFPEKFIQNDLIIPENDLIDEYQYNLVEAKVLTKDFITLYIKKQGINLDKDDCCEGYDRLNTWEESIMDESVSDLEEIYSHVVYTTSSSVLTYKFPVPKIENEDYTLYHKVYIFDKEKGNPECRIYFNNDSGNFISIPLNAGKYFVVLEINYKSDSKTNIANCNGQEITLNENFNIETINFEFVGKSYSPAVALHWTYYKIKLGNVNFSIKGKDICSNSNPCVKGYTCVGGLCERCHASCFDCKNGGLSTDCDTKCSPHSSIQTPIRGSCPLGYVDLTQFDSFTIQDIVPPPRNNRLTISFWIYITSFPENEISGVIGATDYKPQAKLYNSMLNKMNITFFFSHNDITFNCGIPGGNDILSFPISVLNTWYFFKCGYSPDHSEGRSLFIKYFNGLDFDYFYEKKDSGGESGSNNYSRIYKEPEDYITLYFEGFNSLYNTKVPCNIYMKQLVLFREYLPDPYDNKYFNFEKIFTSTFELPEVLFIIPFDELIRSGNKYKVKCYSYAGSILENEITLAPYYYKKNYTLYPPKLFKRLNLLDRNKKYESPDLIKIEDVKRDNNTLIASYDYVPITCIDNYFLTYDVITFASHQKPKPEYHGVCNKDCDTGHSSIHGLAENKGFCNKECSYGESSPICLNNNYDLLHLQSKFKCKSGYFDIFYNCDLRDDSKEKKNVFLYNHDQGPANIVMDVINYNLKSYIIEFWIHLTRCSETPGAKYSLFYTNQFDLYYIAGSEVKYVKTFPNRKEHLIKIERDIWNHIVFEVFYDPKESYDKKSTMYIQTYLDLENPTLIDYSENELPLEYIYFCNGRKASCNGLDIRWYCAHYKNLRLFNGNLAHRYVTYRYDEYYYDYKYLLSSIKLYYPLYGHYIANNLLSQYNSKDSVLNTNSATNNWNYPQYAYSTFNGNTNCNTNCDECFNLNLCYQCKNDNYFLFRTQTNEIICQNNNFEYVLKLPSKANFKLIPLKGIKQPAVTVNFFIKIYGFTVDGKIDIIYLGENIKINYNSDLDSPYFGLNLVTFKGSSETVISNYYDFRKHFGLWTFISVSIYDQTYENFFPPMVRFEINDKKMQIIGPLDHLSIGTIYFADELFALVQRVKVYSTYLIGTLTYEKNEDSNIKNINKNYEDYINYPTNSMSYKSYFEPVSQKEDCLFERFGLIATDKESPDIIIPNYECVSDSLEEVYKEKITQKTKCYKFEDELNYNIKSCNNCDICNGPTKYNCSCNFINNEEKIFLGNVSNHFCRKLSYINFAKAKDIENEINVQKGGNKFTLHFWVFAYSYVDKVFEGLSIEWKYYTTVKVGLDSSGKYYFTCLINGKDTGKYVDFNMNQWNFLHCAVNYDYSKFYIGSENKMYDEDFTYDKKPDEFYSGDTTYLNIKDLTTVKDWGYLFYRYIRLWKDAIKHSSFLSRIKIINNYYSSNLLYQWDTTFNNDHKIKETQNKINFKIKYNEEKIGTNIVPEDIYQEVLDEPYLCAENGQFYDRKTKTCINFTDISNVEYDIEFDKIDVAYSHNYGMAFWILLEDHKNINTSLNFTWQYHMHMALQYVGSTFKAYCFPQNYEPYSKIIEDKSVSLDNRAQNVLNSATNEYTDDLSGVWTWFQCSLSYYNRFFYLNENHQSLIIETLYKEGNTEFKNDEPLGYFYNNIDQEKLSTLKIEITGNRDNSNHTRIYLRCFYLFKDFLPFNYNFKYMDMYRINEMEYPPLTLAINFAEFSFPKMGNNDFNVSYKKFTSLNNEYINETNITLTLSNRNYLELSDKFIFLPLCNPLTKEKYNEETGLCEEITDCDYNALNAIYCMGERTPLICKKNYYLNIDSRNGDVECSNSCKDGTSFRSPGTNETNGICGTDCLSIDILKTCPNSASSILKYQEDFECKQGYSRIGYQCIQEPTNQLPNEGALFYSGVNNPYNIYQKFSDKLNKELAMNYVLEFWFMIDNAIYTNKNFIKDISYHYFYCYPHEIYLKKTENDVGSIKYFYKYINTNKEITKTLIHQYEWNKILIFVDTQKKLITLYINFDKAKKIEISISSQDINKKNLYLKYIAFCSNKGKSSTYYKTTYCTSDNKDIKWASAYYNNIRVWNLLTSTIDTIQSFINGIYIEHPQSLILFYPLKIKYLDNNVMSNIMENYEEHIAFSCPKTTCTIYNKDNIIIYNYSTKFDWGILHKKQFVSSMDDLKIDPNDKNNNCNEHCIRCFEKDNIKECYECEEGYVLQYKECKDARKLYFLKVPSGTAGASINFVTKNKENNDYCLLTSFTIVFWMKFFGVKYPTITEYCKIFSIDSNTYLSFHRSTNNLVFRENSKTAFTDKKFRDYFGIWIPISIANYISNANNDVYPNMFTLSVNKIDIPFDANYKIPESGIKATELSFGYEIIALFAELSIYSKFIQGGYGRIRSEQILTDQFFYKSLTGTKPNDCLTVDSDLQSSIDLICAPDYSVNFIDSYYCKNDQKFFNPYDENNDEKPNDEKCEYCNTACETLCFGPTDQNCTCDMTDGIYWLRRTGGNFDQTYCEHIYYLDFSNINNYTYYNTPITKTKEYTIEFWLYVYSYNQEEKKFKEMYLEWNFHNKITLFDENNSLKVKCQPIWRSFDFSTTTYSDIRESTLKYYSWNYVRCGTDLRNKKYFSNSNVEYDLKAKKDTFFNFEEIDSTTNSALKFFKIYRAKDFYTNFGFVFIREIKMWQQYNLDYLDSQYIFFDMNEITKEEIKKRFPGLLLYYKNEFNLTAEGNTVIREELSGKISILTRSPDYVGYNIVDPDAQNIVSKLDIICPFGHVYYSSENSCKCAEGFDEIGSSCVAGETELDSLCEIYSNKDKQCFQCKENNQYLNKWVDEFGEECYTDCPPTLYEDPLINQCRRCHETCYECTNEFYNNCTSCTGTLYFNFKENTCIPNCQAADLTRSLTKPNICVVFDAGAILVNVAEDIPIDINTFYYIESEVIQPTSSEYETYWLFDVEKTNQINNELGFDDDIPLDSHPFNGDRTKLNTTLNHTFFKTEHKYVFGLRIYAENKGLEVSVYVWWTLTMNSPPYGGKLTVMPYLGLYNTTTFIMRCVDYEDENTPTEELEYYFYYIEKNTNLKIKLSEDFSLFNEVYSNFTVRYYQLEYSNITIYCQVRDKWGAISESSNVITIVNKKNSPLYILKQLVASFYIVDDALIDIQLLARAEVLMSLGINPYTDRVPSSFYTGYENSLTGEKVIITEPQCVNGYCNDNGDCEVIDVALTCKCTASYLGKQCFLDKNGYSDLASYYQILYLRLLDRITGDDAEPINDIIFNAFHRLFFAAQNFFQNDTFFDTNLIEFKTYLVNELNYITENLDRINKLFDLDEMFFNYFYVKETQIKLTKKINEGYQFRNKTLTEEESYSYQNQIYTFFKMIDEDTIFLIKNYGNDYTYTCEHFIYRLKKIDENFDDEEYFESLKTVLFSYKPTVLFMDCLKQKHSSFNFYLNYIEYLVNPMSYDPSFYPNITSPFITIKIYDSNGKEIEVNDCSSPIKINMPFNAYDWINYINQQKWLFLPENYRLEDDPIFKDPVLIWENGSVSDDSVEERIAKYYRYYNIVGLVYTPNSTSLYEYTTFLFKNISDTFFLLFETNHLSSFTSMLIPNLMNFVVDGRFFYIPRYMVLFCYQNHINNPSFYIILALLLIFLFICFIYELKDQEYFDGLDMLEILKKEIIKTKFDYNQIDPGLNDENIFKIIPHVDPKLKKNEMKKITNMFEGYDVDGIQEVDEDNKESENGNEDYISNFIDKNTEYKPYPSTNRKLNNEDDQQEKATEVKSSKRKRDKRIKNSRNNDNPPKRKKNDSDEDEDEDKDVAFNLKKQLRNKRNYDDNSNYLENINKISVKGSKNRTEGNKRKRNEDKKTDKGYGEDDDEDFDEKKVEKNISSEKSTIRYKFGGTKQNFDLNTLNSKLGFNQTKFSKFTKNSKLSSQSKKSYFLDKDKTKANYISINKFHNKSKHLTKDRDILNIEEERKNILEEYTRLNITPYEFFKYNLRTRHILIAPFLNLTLFNNRWKKLIVLLTQFYIQQLLISIILTAKETIIVTNIPGMIIASLIAGIVSNIIVCCFVFLFGTDVYERIRLYRLVMSGEDLFIFKAWAILKRVMNLKSIFGIVICVIFWLANIYVSLSFTAVWKIQRTAWIVCFVITLFLDLVVGEILIEGLCAILFCLRLKYNFWRNLGESLNRFRRYRTMWP